MKFTSLAISLLSVTGALAVPLAEPQIESSELEERQGGKSEAALQVLHGSACALACSGCIQDSAKYGACVAACCFGGGVATFNAADWIANH